MGLSLDFNLIYFQYLCTQCCYEYTCWADVGSFLGTVEGLTVLNGTVQ